MKRFIKISLIIALVFFVAGIILFTVAAAQADFDWQTIFVRQKLHERSESFSGVVTQIRVLQESADVRFVMHEKNEVVVAVTETETDGQGFQFRNGILTVQAVSRRSEIWDHLPLFRAKTSVTVYLPVNSCPWVTAKTSSGDIRVEKGLDFMVFEAESRSGDVAVRSTVHGAASVKTTSGDVEWRAKVSGGNLTIETTSGDLALSGSFSGQVKVTTTSGDLNITGCSAVGTLTVESTSGDVRMEDSDIWSSINVTTASGDLSARKVDSLQGFSVTTSSGDQDFDLCESQRFELESRSGDVKMLLPYARLCSVSSDSGKVSIPDIQALPDREKLCFVRTASGDVDIRVDS